MTNSTTLLLTSPSLELILEIGRREPGWKVHSLINGTPPAIEGGTVWAFVDWLCPDISGLEVCRRLRASPETRGAHITMIIDDTQNESRRRAIEAGADDYMLGPLDIDRILNRIKPSSAPAKDPSKLVHGNLVVDPTAHSANYCGIQLHLRANEFRLLVFFLRNPDQAHSRTALIKNLWHDSGGIDERTVDVWVGRLRRALITQGAPDPLRTVRSIGYVLDSIS